MFTTIHKFMPEKGEAMPELSARQNIVVVADEAHRSQYGFGGKVDEKTGEMSYGFASNPAGAGRCLAACVWGTSNVEFQMSNWCHGSCFVALSPSGQHSRCGAGGLLSLCSPAGCLRQAISAALRFAVLGSACPFCPFLRLFRGFLVFTGRTGHDGRSNQPNERR